MLTWLTSPISSRPLGLARIIIGVAALIRSMVALRVLTGLTDPEVLRTPFFDWMPPPTMPLVVVIISVWAVASVLFAMGWRVPVSGPLLLGAMVATIALDQQAYSNHLYLMAWLVLLLTVADAGAAMAVRSADRPVSRWPVLLIMGQASIVYSFSALTKFTDSFFSGEVLATVLSGGLVPFPDVLRTPAFLSVLAGIVIIIELSIATFIWLARFRPAAFLLGLGLHMGITLLMAATVELVVFSLEMLALYPLFLSPLTLRVTVPTETWGRRIARFDLLRMVEVELDDTSDDVTVEEDHCIRTGAEAHTRVLQHLVPSLWVAPLLLLPGVRSLHAHRHKTFRRAQPARRVRA